MTVQNKTYKQVDKLVGPKGKTREAIVFLGAGGDIQEWVDGITGLLIKDDNIMTPGDDWYLMTTTGGRTDLVMPVPDTNVHLGKLAIWKVRFGDCSWWSDYRVNYYEHHGAPAPPEAQMDEQDNYDD